MRPAQRHVRNAAVCVMTANLPAAGCTNSPSPPFSAISPNPIDKPQFPRYTLYVLISTEVQE